MLYEKDNSSIQYESEPMIVTDNIGREIFWEDLGRPDGIISK